MQSKKSFFKKELFWDDLHRTWPLWGSAVVLGLLLPLCLWAAGRDELRYIAASALAWNTEAALYGIASSGAPIAMMIYACIAAMTLFHYLYQSRSALGIHALPVTREELFGSHYLAGLALVLIPGLTTALSTAIILTMLLGTALLPAVLTLCVVALLSYIWFFSFACFCGMLTGQLLALPAFYTVLSFLPLALYATWRDLLAQMLFGYSTRTDPGLRLVTRLSPLVTMLGSTGVTLETGPDGVATRQFYGLQYFLAYALVGVVLAGVALALYQRRPLETAGETVSVKCVRPLFRSVVGICGGTLVVAFLSALFNTESAGFTMLYLVPGVFVGYYGAEMLLEKSLRVFSRRNNGPFCILLGSLMLVLCLLAGGGLGYETRVPAADTVESAQIVTQGYYGPLEGELRLTLTDPEDIARLTQAHGNYVNAYHNHREALEQRRNAWVENDRDDGYSQTQLTLLYRLTNGRTLCREYTLYLTQEILAQNTPESQFEALVNEQGGQSTALKQSAERMVLNVDGCTESTADISVKYNYGSAGAAALIDALCEDLDAMGARASLMQNQSEGSLPLYQIYGYLDDTAPAAEDEQSIYSDNLWVNVTPEMRATLAQIEK